VRMLKARCPGAIVRGLGMRMHPWRRIVFHSSSVGVCGGGGVGSSS
jgi:hypothetical protein